MKLYTHFRSSSAYRIRIALNVKGLTPEHVFVDLRPGGSEQQAATYREVNRLGQIPSLMLDDGTVLSQSLAIAEYLDEVFPNPALLPKDPAGRARVRALCLTVATDMHPLHTTRISRYLRDELRHDQAEVDRWIAHWISRGLIALEETVGQDRFCAGDVVTLADVFLVPELYVARRSGVDVTPFQRLLAIEARCNAFESFQDAHPAVQRDAV